MGVVGHDGILGDDMSVSSSVSTLGGERSDFEAKEGLFCFGGYETHVECQLEWGA